MKIFVTGIDTNIGKTTTSAIICKALTADYFKPIQCGDLDESDSIKISRVGIRVFPENLRLPMPKSPNFASKETIDMAKFMLPDTDRPLVVEGAGGVLVPLNDQNFIIDLAKEWDLPVVLVCKSYLGSLNHTLLSVEAIRSRGLEILGLVFNGDKNEESENFLSHRTGLKILLRIGEEKDFNLTVIEKYAGQLKWN
jgi:dethiobiotin synthetase